MGLAGLLLVAAAVDFGHWQSFVRSLVATGKQRTLVEEIARLNEENSALRYQLARLRRDEEISKSAHHDNHAELVEMQTKVAGLNRELAFYRDVIGAAESETGAKVKGIRLRALDASSRFSYRLVVTYLDENDRETEGAVRISVKGELKGEHKSLSLDQVADTGPDNLVFKFKHFHMFEGTLKLPDGFIPRQISVAVQSRIPVQSSSAASYDWAAVLN